MFTNRKIQLFGMALLIVAAVLVTLSAVKAPVLAFIPVTGSNPEGLAQYLRSERSAYEANPNGLAIYHQSERMQAVNWTSSSDPLYKYHQSEWFGK